MYQTVGSPVSSSTLPIGNGFRGSAVIHPSLLKGMANTIGSNTLTNTITRTANIMAPNMNQAVSNLSGIASVPAVAGFTGVPAGATNVIGEIQGQSRVQYVPYQRTVIDYEPVERVQYIPYERKVIEYEDRTRVEQVPVQKTYTDYYAIEYIMEYYPQVIPETKIEYVPVERVQNRVEYYPIERQVVHYPDEMMTGSRRVGGLVGGAIPTPPLGLSRVASSGLIGAPQVRASKLGATYPAGIRPSSAYMPAALGGLISGGSVTQQGVSVKPGSAYGIGPSNYGMGTTVVSESVGLPIQGGTTMKTTVGGVSSMGSNKFLGSGYLANPPSITEIRSGQPRLISR